MAATIQQTGGLGDLASAITALMPALLGSGNKKVKSFKRQNLIGINHQQPVGCRIIQKVFHNDVSGASKKRHITDTNNGINAAGTFPRQINQVHCKFSTDVS